MPKRTRGYQLILYGPDKKYGARPKRGFKRYIYYIVYYEGSLKREYSTGKEDRRAAEEYFHNIWLPSQKEKPDGSLEPYAMEIATALSIYGEEHAPEVVDPARIGDCIDALLTYWDGKTCGTVNKKTCRDYVKHRQKLGREVSTARKELGTLQAAFNHCLQGGYLSTAPKVTLPPKPDAKDRWLTMREVRALIFAAKAEPKARFHLPLFIFMAVILGARSRAILTLQWQRNPSGGWVNLENEIIFWSPPGKRQTNKRCPKETPIPDRLLRLLKSQRRRTRTYVFEIDGKWAGDNKRSFNTACRNAWLERDEFGDPKRGVLKDVTRHTLKHTCITWMMQKGVPIWEVAGFTGTSRDTIERVYAHHAPDYLEQARKAFD